MKKIILSTLAVFAMMTANAENVMQIVPCKATAGTDVYAYINLNNEFDVYTLSFDLVTPTGIRVYTNKSGNLISSSFAVDNTDGRMNYYDEDEEDDVSAFTGGGATLLGSAFFNDGGQEVFRVGGTGQFPIKNNSGKIFKIRLKVDESVPAGVYPLVMRNACIYDDHNNGVENAVYSSYIVVGEPLSANLALKGEIPSFVNEALAEQTGIEALNLTEVTASNGTFTYVDGRNVFGPSTEVKGNVVYKRAAGTSTYSSLKLPFAADVNCLKFVNVENSTANFTAATTVAANESVIVEGAVDVQAENVVLGTATEGKANDGQFYLKNDKFYSVNVTAVVPAFRGLWDMPASASNLRIAVDGNVTGIDAAQIDAQSNAFDLQGRQVQNTKNGVFVVNGKKQFIK